METQKKDKRKVLLVLPLLIVPLMALAFSALGGGKQNSSSESTITAKGINADLPDAKFKAKDPTDKLGYYQQFDNDTAGNRNEIENVAGKLGFNADEDPQTKAINQKLEALNMEISKPEPEKSKPTVAGKNNGSDMKNDVDRLEMLMKSMQQGKAEDPEMAQLSGMLDKIIAIQNPALALASQQAKSGVILTDSLFRAIPAVIVSDQKAIQGATIKLRLQDSILLNGQVIPKGHEVFGICQITNQRLLLNIKNIRLGTSIVPVDLSVYSLDGMAGVYAPEAMVSDAVNSGADDALRNLGIGGFDQSIGVQAAGAGIEAAKSLFSKKVKRIKVKLKAGQPVLLKNNKK